MREKILITVKTYPVPSKKYDELVCTAGINEQGEWRRLYPIPFRKLQDDSQFQKYTWIEVDIEPRDRDYRAESYRPISEINCIGQISTQNEWQERRRIILKEVHTNFDILIKEAKINNKSLAVFKPREIKDFKVEPISREWDPDIIASIAINRQHPQLFDNDKTPEEFFKIVRKLPYKFSYQFQCDCKQCINGKTHTLMNEDWEIGALYWQYYDKTGDETLACKKVKEKFYHEFLKKDLYFFVGTTFEHHNTAKNPFIIIGTFYPPKILQRTLDF